VRIRRLRASLPDPFHCKGIYMIFQNRKRSASIPVAGWLILPFLVAAIYPPAVRAQQDHSFPLWGQLLPGPYRVGFRVEYAFDRSRTWRTTRGYEKPFTPDPDGRPIRLQVWYPAAEDKSVKPMRYEDYVHMECPPAFSALNSKMEERDRLIVRLSVPKGREAALLATGVRACLAASPANGRFPLILYLGGLGADSTSNTVLAEFLASHGYVVATAPILGPTDRQTTQARTQPDMEITVRDLEYAWSMLRGRSNIDESKIAVIGHSLGGVEAIIFAMRNANVSVAVGLDATYGFADAAQVLTGFYGYEPQKMHATVLDLRRAAGEQGNTQDLRAVRGFHYADRYFVTVRKMHHSDFGSFAMVAQAFDFPGDSDPSGWTRKTGYEGYQQVCRTLGEFFDDKLKGDKSAAERFRAEVAHAEAGTLEVVNALPVPPTAGEFVTLIKERGYAAAEGIVDRYRRDAPGDTIVHEATFNTLGYDLLAQSRFADAIAVFRLVCHAYPKSSNAADSLGDAYLAAGQQDKARAAFEQAMDLAAADPALDARSKEAFLIEERKKVQKLSH
jgi:pimeloyl-ACP methyl ester carboxylesterase